MPCSTRSHTLCQKSSAFVKAGKLSFGQPARAANDLAPTSSLVQASQKPIRGRLGRLGLGRAIEAADCQTQAAALHAEECDIRGSGAHEQRLRAGHEGRTPERDRGIERLQDPERPQEQRELVSPLIRRVLTKMRVGGGQEQQPGHVLHRVERGTEEAPKTLDGAVVSWSFDL